MIYSARNEKKPSLKYVFSDVYDILPLRLEKQQREMQAMIEKYPDHYPTKLHK